MVVTIVLTTKSNLSSHIMQHYFYKVFIFSCEKDNLEGTLKRLFTIKDLTHKDHKGQTISVRLKMLQGDLKQVNFCFNFFQNEKLYRLQVLTFITIHSIFPFANCALISKNDFMEIFIFFFF